MLVAIAGLPGSGKTTAARLVAAELDLPLVSAGAIFRTLAAERGVTLAEFSQLAEADHSIDLALDDRMLSIARVGNAVLEGRLVAWLVGRNRIPAMRVYLAAPEQIRAQRVAGRDGGNPTDALAANRAREQSEALRYKAIYGVSMDDSKYYDLFLSTLDLGPEAIAHAVVEAARKNRAVGGGS